MKKRRHEFDSKMKEYMDGNEGRKEEGTCCNYVIILKIKKSPELIAFYTVVSYITCTALMRVSTMRLSARAKSIRMSSLLFSNSKVGVNFPIPYKMPSTADLFPQ